MSSVLVLIPSLDGNVCAEMLGGLLACAPMVSALHLCVQCSDIRMARNRLAHAFLASDAEWSFWIDADIGFTQQDAQYLFSGDDSLVVGPYARKGYGQHAGSTDVGMGFVRMHRAVLEHLAPRCTTISHENEPLTDFFVSGPDEQGRWRGEDRAFFELCAQEDIAMRIENRCNLVHIGRAPYRIRPDIQLQVAGTR